MANSIIGNAGGNASSLATPQMLQRIQQFGNALQGDPKQMVMNMLQSGQITNAQLQNAMQVAQQVQGLIK